MQTLRLNSTGSDVVEWQKIIGVTPADGIFGPATEAATKKWQSERKLVPDGIVGAASWAAAGKKSSSGSSDLPPKSSSAPTDQWAYGIVKKAMPSLPEYKVQYLLTVSRGEGFYGKAQNPPVWIGSNNWGAVQGTGPAGFFNTTDHHADGTSYNGKFKKYHTPEEGAIDMARILFGGGKRGKAGAEALDTALRRGDLNAATQAQRDNGYYELVQSKYHAAAVRNYNQLTANLGWQDLLSAHGHRFLDWAKWTLITTVTGVVGLGALFLTKRL